MKIYSLVHKLLLGGRREDRLMQGQTGMHACARAHTHTHTMKPQSILSLSTKEINPVKVWKDGCPKPFSKIDA